MHPSETIVTFRPMHGDDIPLLHDWLRRPHVIEWWGGDPAAGINETREKYLPRIFGAAGVNAYIAMSESRPIGFAQSYVAVGAGDGWWEDETDPGARGIDHFLCDGNSLGQGLGTRMVTAFVHMLFSQPGVTRVQVDPSPDNARAIRCYEKSGFRQLRNIVTPDGPALLMVQDNPLRPLSFPQPIYDRQLLLSGTKRNALLDLWEVQRYGIDSYGDADYVSVYGMRPAHWYARGARLMGRTAVECTCDPLASAIGEDVADVAAMAPRAARALVVDLFAGSGNTLYWLMRHLPDAKGWGFELDAGVFRLTHQNLAALALPVEVRNTDYRSGMADVSVTAGQLLIAFIAPPWGDALERTTGLDLRRTDPPIIEIVNFLFNAFMQSPLLCVVQVYEAINAESLAELKACFDWSMLRVYAMNAPGQNHGILLGSKRWVPQAAGS